MIISIKCDFHIADEISFLHHTLYVYYLYTQMTFNMSSHPESDLTAHQPKILFPDIRSDRHKEAWAVALDNG